MEYYVYCLINPITNLPFYIGKGTGNRAYVHTKFKDNNNNLHKDNTIRKILQAGEEPEVVFLHEGIQDEVSAYELEIQEIAKVGINNLTNICENSNPPSRKGQSMHFTQEHRDKISSALKGKAKKYPSWNKGKTKETDSRVKRMAEARAEVGNKHQIGQKYSKNRVQKIREVLLGRTMTQEQKEKMSKAKKGKTWEQIFGKEEAEKRRKAAKNRKSSMAKQVTTPEGLFDSVTAARKYYGIAEATVRNRCLSEKFPEWKYV